ncbi:unnamed protein product, partial [Owenia fusiformis]
QGNRFRSDSPSKGWHLPPPLQRQEEFTIFSDNDQAAKLFKDDLTRRTSTPARTSMTMPVKNHVNRVSTPMPSRAENHLVGIGAINKRPLLSSQISIPTSGMHIAQPKLPSNMTQKPIFNQGVGLSRNHVQFSDSVFHQSSIGRANGSNSTGSAMGGHGLRVPPNTPCSGNYRKDLEDSDYVDPSINDSNRDVSGYQGKSGGVFESGSNRYNDSGYSDGIDSSGSNNFSRGRTNDHTFSAH